MKKSKFSPSSMAMILQELVQGRDLELYDENMASTEAHSTIGAGNMAILRVSHLGEGFWKYYYRI